MINGDIESVSVTVSQCHSVTVSQCHSVTVSQCHSVTVACIQGPATRQVRVHSVCQPKAASRCYHYWAGRSPCAIDAAYQDIRLLTWRQLWSLHYQALLVKSVDSL